MTRRWIRAPVSSEVAPALRVCAPAACSEEMVGRYVAAFLLDALDPYDPATWPRLGTEVCCFQHFLSL